MQTSVAPAVAAQHPRRLWKSGNRPWPTIDTHMMARTHLSYWMLRCAQQAGDTRTWCQFVGAVPIFAKTAWMSLVVLASPSSTSSVQPSEPSRAIGFSVLLMIWARIGRRSLARACHRRSSSTTQGTTRTDALPLHDPAFSAPSLMQSESLQRRIEPSD